MKENYGKRNFGYVKAQPVLPDNSLMKSTHLTLFVNTY